jgi:hypothetical protein
MTLAIIIYSIMTLTEITVVKLYVVMTFGIKALSIMTFSINKALGIKTFIITTQHNN